MHHTDRTPHTHHFTQPILNTHTHTNTHHHHSKGLQCLKALKADDVQKYGRYCYYYYCYYYYQYYYYYYYYYHYC
jgi:hypothetical protein